MAAVLARDSHRCVICRSDRGVTVHHLESLAQGGTADMRRLASLCQRCHSEGHEQILLLRVEEDGRVTPLDAEGKEIRRQESAAEVLADGGEDCPLETIERLDAAAGAAAPGSSVPASNAPAINASGTLDLSAMDPAGMDTAAMDRAAAPPASAGPGGGLTGASAPCTSAPCPWAPCAPAPCTAVAGTVSSADPGARAELPAALLASSAPPAGLDSPASISSARSVDELPAEITSREWRELEGLLDWSPTHHAFFLRPKVDAEDPLDTEEPLPTAVDPPSREGAQGAACREPPERPRSFEDFVGQRRAVGNLLLAARAAAARGEPLGHALLHGPAGLGKTTIARLLAAECGSGIQEVVAGHIANPHQLISLLARLREGEFLFIDEIHGLTTACEEALYPALEDRRVDVVLRDRSRTRTIRVHLEAFTLVGATTRLGALPEPFRARFRLKERLEPYDEEDLAEIVGRAAGRLGAPVTIEAAREVARRSGGIPRDAIRLLERARDVAQVSAAAEASKTSQASQGSEDAPLSQVTLDQEVKLAHVGQDPRLSADATRAQISAPAKSQKRAALTYDGGEATSPADSAAESAAETEAPAARGTEPAPSGAPVVGTALIVMAAHVIEAACRSGIDNHGLAREERGIVGLLLERGKPKGLEAIASALQLDLETLRDVHEPRLERAGLVERTVHGRVATGKARAWYGQFTSRTPACPLE